MRRIAIAAATIAAALAAPALGQAFVGEWLTTAHVQDTDVSERVSVAKSGDSYVIAAKLATPQPEGAQTPEAGPATNIKLDGNNFSYVRSLDFNGTKLEINYSGVITGDTFKATAEVGGTTIPYTGVRVK